MSRYIDTAFADKGSHQKKKLQPKCPDTSKFGLLGKPTKKLELNIIYLIAYANILVVRTYVL